MDAKTTPMDDGMQACGVTPHDAPARARELIALLRRRFQDELAIAMSGDDDLLERLQGHVGHSAPITEALRACLAALVPSSPDAPATAIGQVEALVSEFEAVLVLAGESARITGVLREEVVEGLALLKNLKRARAGYGAKPRARGALFDMEG